MLKCNFHSFPVGCEDVLREGLAVWRGKSLLGVICKIAWASTVYNLWRHRNSLKFGNSLWSEEQIKIQIKWEIGTWIMGNAKGKFRASTINELFANWGIPSNILV